LAVRITPGREFLLDGIKALADTVYRVGATDDGALEPVEEPRPISSGGAQVPALQKKEQYK
ncbi:MAG: hypothetical protein ACREJQ_02985, partial [bacterium]